MSYRKRGTESERMRSSSAAPLPRWLQQSGLGQADSRSQAGAASGSQQTASVNSGSKPITLAALWQKLEARKPLDSSK